MLLPIRIVPSWRVNPLYLSIQEKNQLNVKIWQFPNKGYVLSTSLVLYSISAVPFKGKIVLRSFRIINTQNHNVQKKNLRNLSHYIKSVSIKYGFQLSRWYLLVTECKKEKKVYIFSELSLFPLLLSLHTRDFTDFKSVL